MLCWHRSVHWPVSWTARSSVRAGWLWSWHVSWQWLSDSKIRVRNEKLSDTLWGPVGRLVMRSYECTVASTNQYTILRAGAQRTTCFVSAPEILWPPACKTLSASCHQLTDSVHSVHRACKSVYIEWSTGVWYLASDVHESVTTVQLLCSALRVQILDQERAGLGPESGSRFWTCPGGSEHP